jgi:hypothetical protein
MTDKELKELAKKKSAPLIFEADMSIFASGYEQGYRDCLYQVLKDSIDDEINGDKFLQGIQEISKLLKNEQKDSK